MQSQASIFSTLPDDIFIDICLQLDIEELSKLAQANKELYKRLCGGLETTPEQQLVAGSLSPLVEKFWKKIFETLFPHRVEETEKAISEKNEINWFTACRMAYKLEYQVIKFVGQPHKNGPKIEVEEKLVELPKRSRRLLNLTKMGDLSNLKAEKITASELLEIADRNKINILTWAQRKRRAAEQHHKEQNTKQSLENLQKYQNILNYFFELRKSVYVAFPNDIRDRQQEYATHRLHEAIDCHQSCDVISDLIKTEPAPRLISMRKVRSVPPIYCAIKQQLPAVVKLLLENGVGVSDQIYEFNHRTEDEIFLENGFKGSELALFYGRFGSVLNSSPLRQAVRVGNVEIVQLLLADIKNKLQNYKDPQNLIERALLVAIRYKKDEIRDLLIKFSETNNIKINYDSCLLDALEANDVETMEYLIVQRKQDVNALITVGGNKASLLQIAVNQNTTDTQNNQNHQKMVQWLVDHGATIDEKLINACLVDNSKFEIFVILQKAKRAAMPRILTLPDAMLLEIAVHSTPEAIRNLSFTNKKFSKLFLQNTKETQRLWRGFCYIVFPDAAKKIEEKIASKEIKDAAKVNWYSIFRDNYLGESYLHLPSRSRQILTAGKMGDIHSLKSKTINLTISDLVRVQDTSKVSLIEWVQRKKREAKSDLKFQQKNNDEKGIKAAKEEVEKYQIVLNYFHELKTAEQNVSTPESVSNEMEKVLSPKALATATSRSAMDPNTLSSAIARDLSAPPAKISKRECLASAVRCDLPLEVICSFFDGKDDQSLIGPGRLRHKDQSLLLDAVKLDSVEVIQLLLSKGADPTEMYTEDNISLIIEVVKINHLEILKILLKTITEDLNKASDKKICKNFSELYISHFPLQDAIKLNRVEIVKELIAFRKNNTIATNYNELLTLAIENNRVEIAEWLITEGADVNAANYVAMATLKGQTEMVRVLVAHKAKTNETHVEMGHRYGTPLFIATSQQSNNSELVNILLNAEGTDPSPKLATAVCCHKENTHLRFGEKDTPLHAAVQSGNLQSINSLLDAGADPCAKNELNQTPSQLLKKVDLKRGNLPQHNEFFRTTSRLRLAEYIKMRKDEGTKNVTVKAIGFGLKYNSHGIQSLTLFGREIEVSCSEKRKRNAANAWLRMVKLEQQLENAEKALMNETNPQLKKEKEEAFNTLKELYLENRKDCEKEFKKEFKNGRLEPIVTATLLHR